MYAAMYLPRCYNKNWVNSLPHAARARVDGRPPKGVSTLSPSKAIRSVVLVL